MKIVGVGIVSTFVFQLIVVANFNETLVRVLFPLTLVSLLIFFWSWNHFLGFWIGSVGLIANLLVVVANGGLMPIDAKILEEHGEVSLLENHDSGSWLEGSKYQLVVGDDGKLLFLADSIQIPVGNRGTAVLSPGDIVLFLGTLTIIIEGFLRRDQHQIWYPKIRIL